MTPLCALPRDAAVALGKYRVHPIVSQHFPPSMQVVDGALGAQWLAAFKKYVEDPLNMLV